MIPTFELSKWYADCTSEDGSALIIYQAVLRWRASTIHYANLLIHEGGLLTRSRFSLRKKPPLVVHDGRIAWKTSAWNAEGSWCETGSALHEVLIESEAGSAEWNCVAPRSVAEIRIGTRRPHRGWGYVEHLRLSIPPWRLQIQQLRWGRFVNATDALVWIDWRGSSNRQIVYHNGLSVSARTISDQEIAFTDSEAVLSLDKGTVLRQGALGTTVLSILPGFKRLFPANILGIHECKWLSRAVLRQPGHADSFGMAIHEVVEWP
jgi:hypothetical protein